MTEMICAGFGGQGVLTTGMIIISAGMKKGQHVSFYPSYGSEMRGGTANCNLKMSDKEIASPYAKMLDVLYTMNGPAIDKFEARIKPGGLLLVNTSIVPESRTYRNDIKTVKLHITEIAANLDNPRGSNIVMLGAFVAGTDLFELDFFEEVLTEFFGKKGKVNPKNALCFRKGFEEAKKQL